MKNRMFALLLSCIAFLSCQSVHAGLLGEQLSIRYDYFSIDGDGYQIVNYESGLLTVESPSSSKFGVIVDDLTITIKPSSYLDFSIPITDLRYTIDAFDGLLPALDWATFATTFPNFDLDSRVINSKAGFSVNFSGLPVNQDYTFSVSILGTTLPGNPGGGTVAVPEPPVIGMLAIGLLAFIRSRRQTQTDMHSRSQA